MHIKIPIPLLCLILFFVFIVLPPKKSISQVPTKEYTVKKGDTLYSIALQNNLTIDAIKRWNNLSSNFLQPGQKLQVSPPNILRSDAPPMAVYPDSDLKSGSTLYCIMIGVSNQDDPTISRLPYAKSDADTLAKIFNTQQRKLYEKVDIDIPKKSTYEEINTAFNRVSDRATENDLILIFISSHAKMDSVNGLMILPRDYNKDEDGLNGLSCLDIMRFTYQPKCPKILFLDVCYAGGAAVNAIEGIKYLGQDLMSGQFSLLVGSNDAEGYESDSLRAGVMTHSVIKGLAGLADVHRPDGVVTLNELNGYISSEVSYITKGKQKSYMPINFNGDLPIFKYELKEKQKPIPLLPKKHQ